MRLLVTGGREFADIDLLVETLGDYLGEDVHLFHGAATGADTLAAQFGQAAGWKVTGRPAKWREHGKAAGGLRNSELLAYAQPDLLVVFPGGAGTGDMVAKAREAGVKIRMASATKRFAT